MKYLAVRESVLKEKNGQWLHFFECESFEEAKDRAKQLNELHGS